MGYIDIEKWASPRASHGFTYGRSDPCGWCRFLHPMPHHKGARRRQEVPRPPLHFKLLAVRGGGGCL